MTRDALVDGYTVFVGELDSAAVPAGDEGGLYHRDTRHLSELRVTVEGMEEVTLQRSLAASNRRQIVSANGESMVNRVDETSQKRSCLVSRTTQAVRAGTGLVQRIELTNYSPATIARALRVHFDADFADLFEVRGFASTIDRDVRTEVAGRTATMRYEYEDATGQPVTRTTSIAFDTEPRRLDADSATFDLSIPPRESRTLALQVRPGMGDATVDRDAGTTDLIGDTLSQEADTPFDLPTVQTGRDGYDRVFSRAAEDLEALTADTDHGPVPLAGMPWFATVFGRDSLIAAYQALPLDTALARGTLRFLAAHQGVETDEEREEEPGKIFHEIRNGELAGREQIPHTPYYGSIDATPLWIVVLAALWRWTGDDNFVGNVAKPLDRALEWLDCARDRTDDPFLTYGQSSTMGLTHKGWRDTPGSVQFPDGTVASPPIATVEVQGYVYRALHDAATLFDAVLDDPDRAETLRDDAERLAEAFETTFWLPEREFYAAATAAEGVVPTKTSNVGHCLWAGLPPDGRAEAVARTLMSEEFFSGWGIRTMSTTADGYSPVSYHLGSVWPHDTSMVALGMARYGQHDRVETLATAVLDAATQFENDRIPELFCGFDDDLAPVPYPSACVPQAWSAGTPFALLRAMFDLSPPAERIAVGNRPGVIDDDAISSLYPSDTHD